MPATQTVAVRLLNISGYDGGFYSGSPALPTLDGGFFADGVATRRITALRVSGESATFVSANTVVLGITGDEEIANHEDFSITLAYTDTQGTIDVELHPISDTTAPYQFTPHEDDLAAFNALIDRLTANPAAIFVTLSVTLSNEPRAPAINFSIATGTPTARMALAAPAIKFPRLERGIPRARMQIRAPDPKIEVQTGTPTARMGLDSPAIIIKAETGAPTVRVNLDPSKRLAFIVSTGTPTARMDLESPRVKIPTLETGTPTARMALAAPVPRTAPLATGSPTVRMALAAPPVRIAIATGNKTARMDLEQSLTIRIGPLFTGAPEVRMPLAAPPLKFPEISTGAPTVQMRLSAPVPRFPVLETGIPRVRMQLAGGPREAVFAVVPDLRLERQRVVDIELPRVRYERPGGTYTVAGLPEGLVYDADTHRLTGTPTAPMGDYQVQLGYTDPAPDG